MGINMQLITPIPFYLYVIGYDIWFYAAHRAFHTRLLYRFHKKHHEKRRPTLDDTFHADTLENTVMWFGILMPIPFIGIHLFNFLAAMFYTYIRGYMRHDVKYVELVGWHHLNHHLHPNYNYSSQWIDALMGTEYKPPPASRKWYTLWQS